MLNKSVSMRDIAEKAGVSVSTVSLALKNSSRISAETKHLVERIAKECGYTPDPRVTELMEHLRIQRSKRKASQLALLVPELTEDCLSSFVPLKSMINGMTEQAHEAGFGLDIIYLEKLKASFQRVRSILQARGIKGVLLAPFSSGVGQLPMDFDGFSVATAGYSITSPNFSRACPNYLQMMDEMLEHLCSLGYKRIGFIMTYHEGGIGHKLFSSSFLYYQTKIPPAWRLPILSKSEISDSGIRDWIERHRPEVIISSGDIFARLNALGIRIPDDIGFGSLDLSEAPHDAAGMHHRHRDVGREAVKLVLSALNLNITGVPENPRIVLVDSHRKTGRTLSQIGKPINITLRKTLGY